jgi:hypothetical protein
MTQSYEPTFLQDLQQQVDELEKEKQRLTLMERKSKKKGALAGPGSSSFCLYITSGGYPALLGSNTSPVPAPVPFPVLVPAPVPVFVSRFRPFSRFPSVSR